MIRGDVVFDKVFVRCAWLRNLAKRLHLTKQMPDRKLGTLKEYLLGVLNLENKRYTSSRYKYQARH